MEKDEASSNDFTDYYGSIKRMNDMFSVLEKTNDFIEDIKQSDIYMEYEASLYELKKYPEWKEKTDVFRKQLFEAQQAINGPVSFADVESLENRYEEVLVCPEIARFLNAELALCRLLQRIQGNMIAALDFE